MRSIKEWMFEKGLLGEDFDKNSMSRYFGSTTIEVDQGLRRELKPKIERIMDMDEYKAMPKDEMLKKIKVVVSQAVADLGGSRLTSRGLADRLGDDENSVNKSKFSRMMGSESLEVDMKLRQELKPKLERIMDMDEYRDMPKSELEEKLIAVVSQLVAEMSGGSMSVGSLAKRMDKREDDPVAHESAGLPSFLRWIENNEGDAVSEPQHKEGEASMDLKGVVEKRLMQMAMEIESEGKGSRQEVLAAMKAVVDSAGRESEQGGDNQGDPNAQSAGQAPLGNEGPMSPPQGQPQQGMQPQVQN